MNSSTAQQSNHQNHHHPHQYHPNHRLSTRPIMKHLFNGKGDYSNQHKGSSSSSSRSSTTTSSSWQHKNSHENFSTSFNPTPTSVVNRLLAAIDTVDSAAVVDYSTVQRLISIMESRNGGRCSPAELGKKEVLEALKRAVAKEVARVTKTNGRLFSAGRKGSEGDEKISSFSNVQKDVHRVANRVLLRLIEHLEEGENKIEKQNTKSLNKQQKSTENSAKNAASETKSSQSQSSLQSSSSLSSNNCGSSSANSSSNFSSHCDSRASSSATTSAPFVNSTTTASSSSSSSSSSREDNEESSLTDDSDEFDSGALMAKNKKQQNRQNAAKQKQKQKKKTSKKNKNEDKVEVKEEKVQSLVEDPGDELISWADACCTSPTPEEVEDDDQVPPPPKVLKVPDLLEIIEKLQITGKDEDEEGDDDKKDEDIEEEVEDYEDEDNDEDENDSTDNGNEEEDNGGSSYQYRPRRKGFSNGGGRFQLRQPSPNFHRQLHHQHHNHNFNSNRLQELSNQRGSWRGRHSPFGHRGGNSSPQISCRTTNSTSSSEFYYQSANATLEPTSSAMINSEQNHSGSEENCFSKQSQAPLSPPRRIMNFMSVGAMPHYPGVNDERMNEILNRTGYYLELSNGQRKYGPPPSHPSYRQPAGASSSSFAGCEIFVGRIPREIFEDELIPLFESVGAIYDLRLMIDPLSGCSRGYAFITYFKAEEAASAVEIMNDYEIRPGKTLKVKVSIPNVRLFIGNIPKQLDKAEIKEEFGKVVAGLTEVIVYSDPLDRSRNRGFCFLEFDSHKLASQAKRKLLATRIKLWPNADMLVDWAEPLDEPDEATMSRVKVLYVRNLPLATSEQTISGVFSRFGPVERVKKIKDYAFVHFGTRETALEAMEAMQGRELVEGSKVERKLEISLAKPPNDRRRKEEILRNRERRLSSMNMSVALQQQLGGLVVANQQRSMNSSAASSASSATSYLAYNERNYPPISSATSVSNGGGGNEGGISNSMTEGGSGLIVEGGGDEPSTSLNNLVEKTTTAANSGGGEGDNAVFQNSERSVLVENPAPVHLLPQPLAVPQQHQSPPALIAHPTPTQQPPHHPQMQQQMGPPPPAYHLHRYSYPPPPPHSLHPHTHFHPQHPPNYQVVAAAAAAAAFIASGGHGHGPGGSMPSNPHYEGGGCSNGGCNHHHYHPHLIHQHPPPPTHVITNADGHHHHNHYPSTPGPAPPGASGVPSPSAVARVTLGPTETGSVPPPPPTNAHPPPLYLMHSFNPPNFSTCVSNAHQQSSEECGGCSCRGLITKCGGPLLHPPPQPPQISNWYNCYDPNWWYAASVAHSQPQPQQPLLPSPSSGQVLVETKTATVVSSSAPISTNTTSSEGINSSTTTRTDGEVCGGVQFGAILTAPAATVPITSAEVATSTADEVDSKEEENIKNSTINKKTKTTSESSNESNSSPSSNTSEKAGEKRTMAQVAAAGAAKAEAAAAAAAAAQQHQLQEQAEQQVVLLPPETSSSLISADELAATFPPLSSSSTTSSGLKKIGTVPGKRGTGGGGVRS